MPFGIKSTPRIFNKILRPAIQFIRNQLNLMCIAYCDDHLFLNQNFQKLRDKTLLALRLLQDLGWIISMDKCGSGLNRNLYTFNPNNGCLKVRLGRCLLDQRATRNRYSLRLEQKLAIFVIKLEKTSSNPVSLRRLENQLLRNIVTVIRMQMDDYSTSYNLRRQAAATYLAIMTARNQTADALSRLSRSGDCFILPSRAARILKLLDVQPTQDVFATRKSKNNLQKTQLAKPSHTCCISVFYYCFRQPATVRIIRSKH
ncbi:MAG: hypothetical protein EZS28_036423 [Streblomastix strix]|uniref:Reverse transcriptase domain-containing protein n=1 Tax=Streblomastix strix TaxID=222440 RepID=A0A5J4UCW6_9EUKA|nr:MAG: hypothetical protein EZS28_036423 [Streblomastix strix]